MAEMQKMQEQFFCFAIAAAGMTNVLDINEA